MEADGPIILTERLLGGAVDLLDGVGRIEVLEEARELGAHPLREHRDRLPGAQALVTQVTDAVDRDVLDLCGPSLRVVANCGVGYDNLDVEAAAARGVVVTNTPGVVTPPTADLAMGLILMAMRRLAEGDRLVRSGGRWGLGMRFMLGHALTGTRLGVVGFGSIGQALARRARAFDMSVCYADVNVIDTDVDAVRVDLEELLATADVVSLHTPLLPVTRHLIGWDELRAMQPTSCLVNTARGGVVDEAALAKALRDGEIACAALDVFEHEPEVSAELRELPNVVLTPHLGTATVEDRANMAELAARNVRAVLSGGEPLTPVPSPG